MEEPAAHNGSAAGAAPGAGTPARPPATPEGMALAYGSLVLMALLPIFFGALRSVSCAKSKNSSEMPETITSRDAARFPIVASCTLLGLYLFFKIFSQEYINLLLSMYFFVLGILALSHTISPMMNRFFPANFPNKQYQLLFTQGSGESKEEIVNYEFDTKDLVCLALSSVVGVWYLLRKHWIANNLFGLAFSLNGVELLHLNNVSTGCILLGGLFIYDVFWVFGTNVMVTVAKSFEAPIKLVFPQDLLEKGLDADNFAMLGLGDIVIPGIFIALLLRFDISLKKNTHTYFYTSFVAYIFGLGLTIFIMHIFKHAQPALLYLVPACIGFPLLVALAKGEVTEMFRFWLRGSAHASGSCLISEFQCLLFHAAALSWSLQARRGQRVRAAWLIPCSRNCPVPADAGSRALVPCSHCRRGPCLSLWPGRGRSWLFLAQALPIPSSPHSVGRGWSCCCVAVGQLLSHSERGDWEGQDLTSQTLPFLLRAAIPFP
ncbi:PREDICTED: minor histocompatibility antigen H13 isoform X1 [Sturnus vulgaris]|uniref:minor histocompatibility antigen H13 isoform X1 n=1 Tax=Sturnus vulgaris TaxID=9172 RepID=UPI00071A337C|nr:PREDICTED: minor histocompatibility antigen H13 isoform X1 [Sturnus vulgaris]